MVKNRKYITLNTGQERRDGALSNLLSFRKKKKRSVFLDQLERKTAKGVQRQS